MYLLAQIKNVGLVYRTSALFENNRGANILEWNYNAAALIDNVVRPETSSDSKSTLCTHLYIRNIHPNRYLWLSLSQKNTSWIDETLEHYTKFLEILFAIKVESADSCIRNQNLHSKINPNKCQSKFSFY